MPVPEGLPEIPAQLVDPKRASQIMYRLVRKQLQRQLGNIVGEIKDEVRREFDMSEDEAKTASLYYIDIARIVVNELLDEMKERITKRS
jgi:hypothetical protein